MDIYEQHKTAFANVSAYVILLKGERVATIAFRYPRDGASRLYAYVHWFGTTMTRGFASGGGYDKHSAACANAVRKAVDGRLGASDVVRWDKFRAALAKDDGQYWNWHLEQAGFTVLQAV